MAARGWVDLGSDEPEERRASAIAADAILADVGLDWGTVFDILVFGQPDEPEASTTAWKRVALHDGRSGCRRHEDGRLLAVRQCDPVAMGWLVEIDDGPVTDGFDRAVLFSSEEAAMATADTSAACPSRLLE